MNQENCIELHEFFKVKLDFASVQHEGIDCIIISFALIHIQVVWFQIIHIVDLEEILFNVSVGPCLTLWCRSVFEWD